MSWGPSPEYADWWYAVSWKGIIWAGVATALAASAVVIFTALQFWSDGVRDKKSEARQLALETETAEARKITAQAQERIAELNNETARLYSRLAWRVLDDDQQARITAKAKEIGARTFSIVTYTDDLEAANLGALIRQSLEKAGWTHANTRPLDWLDSGVSVETGRAEEQTVAAVAAELVRALNAEGVVTKQVLNPKYDAHPTVLFVIVGKKPPTGVDLPGRGLP